MNYFEYTFTLEPLLPAREVLTVMLAEMGFESFVDTDAGLKAYIPEDLAGSVDPDSTGISEWPGQSVRWERQLIPDQNWNAEWERNFSPIEVGEKLLIRAPFHEHNPSFEHQIVIEPKMSFGTGHHATTWLVAEALLRTDLVGKQVLDMGCGTGVLAILAFQRGASDIVAIDIDEWAYENTIENCQRNGCPHIQVILGGAESIPNNKFDVIIANINRNILIRDASDYLKVLKPGGVIFLSGFYAQDIPLLQEAFSGVQFSQHREREGWCMLEGILL